MAHDIEVTASFDASEIESGLNQVNEILSNLPDSVTTIIESEDNITTELESIKSALDEIPEEYTVTITADASDAISTIDDVKSSLESLSDIEVNISVIDNATPIIEEVANNLSGVDADITANITVDDQATTTIEAVATALGELDGSTATVSILVDDQATAVIKSVQSALSEVDDTVANATITVDDQATSGIEEIATKLQEIDETVATPTITIDDSVSDALSEVESSLQNIADTDVSIDTEGATNSIEETNNASNTLLQTLGEIGAAVGITSLIYTAGQAETSMKRLEMAGRAVGLSQEQLKTIVDELGVATGRSGGMIRESLIQLMVAGITSSDTLKTVFEGISGAAFITGKSVDTVTNAYARLISSQTLSSRMLRQLGISDADVIKYLGISVDELKERWKSLTPEQRAAYLNSILMAKYGTAANEEYKNSFQGLMDRITVAVTKLAVSIGKTLLPTIKPILESAIWLFTKLGEAINAAPAPIKFLIGSVVALIGAFASLSIAWKALSTVFGWGKDMIKGAGVALNEIRSGLPTLRGHLTTAREALSSMGRTAKDAFTGLIDRMRAARVEGGLLNTTISRIRALPGMIIDSFRRLKDAILQSRIAQALFNTEQDRGFIATMRNAVASAAAAAKNVILTAATYAAAAAQTVFNAVMSANPIFLVIMAIAALISILLYLWNTNEGFRNAVLGLWDNLKSLGGFIWGVLIGAWNALKGALDWVWGGLNNVWKAISSVGSAFSQLGGILQMVALGPLGFILAIMRLLAPILVNVGTAIVAYLSNALTSVANTIVSFARVFFNVLIQLPGLAVGALSRLGSIIYSAVSAVMRSAYTLITSIFNTLISGISRIPSRVYSIAVSIGKYILSGLVSAVNLIRSGITRVISVITQLPNYLSKLGSTLLSHITRAFKSLASYISSTAATLIRKALTTIWDKFTNFVGQLSNLPKSILNSIKKAFTAVINYLKSVPRRIWDALLSIANKFVDFLKWLVSLPSKFLEAGKNIIKRLIDGIISGIPGLKKVLEWISRLFPKSPAKEGPLRELDKMGAGFANELNRGFLEGFKGFYDTIERSLSKIDTLIHPNVGLEFAGYPISNISVTRPLTENNINIGVNVNVDKLSDNVDVHDMARQVGDIITEKLKTELLRKGIPPGLYGENIVRRITL